MILLKTTFSQISIYSQLLVKILWRPDKEKNTFKAIEKYRLMASEKLYRNTWNIWKNSGGSSKFPGGLKVIHRSAQTAFVRVVTLRQLLV